MKTPRINQNIRYVIKNIEGGKLSLQNITNEHDVFSLNVEQVDDKYILTAPHAIVVRVHRLRKA